MNKIIEKAKKIFYERRKNYEGKRQALVNRKTAYEGRKKVMEDKLFDGVISDEDFTTRRDEMNVELEAIEQQLADLHQKQELKVDIAQEILLFTRDIYKAYKKASSILKRHYLGFFWQKFEVSDGVIIKSHPTLLFDELMKLEQVVYKTPKTEKREIPSVLSEVIINDTLLPLASDLRTYL